MVERGETGPALVLAPLLFVLANAAIAALAIGTLWLAVRGRLLPRLEPGTRPR